MKIIPVLDLKNGVVVHAKQGMRDTYQPINTPLCQDADIYKVIEAFLSLYKFDTFYIADLNAITLQGDHDDLITAVVTAYPQLQFWVDRGYQKTRDYPRNYLPVLGSECFTDTNIEELRDFNERFILSLDYAQAGALGASSILIKPELWPETVIIMTMFRVGSQLGPDVDKLSTFCTQYPHKKFVAAGGIRKIADLQSIKALGVQHALLASALHSGTINKADIANL